KSPADDRQRAEPPSSPRPPLTPFPLDDAVCAAQRRERWRKRPSADRSVVDVQRRPARDEPVQARDLLVAQADAAVRRAAGDEARLVGAVQADDAAPG